MAKRPLDHLGRPFRGLRTRLFGSGTGPKRYQQLLDILGEQRATRLMEIGTWDGQNALRMIQKAQIRTPAVQIEYYGFDLFELMTEELLEEEVSKWPPPRRDVETLLKHSGATIQLFQGFTSDTLPWVCAQLPVMDLIYIDGGHKLDTIRNDWHYSQQLMGPHTVVVFDDYYSGDWASRQGIGCRELIDVELDTTTFHATILPIEDRFRKPDGTVQRINMVRVERR